MSFSKSLEFKHRNISAVLQEMFLPWIRGYKPAPNYQDALFEAVDRYLTGNRGILDHQPVLHPTMSVEPHDVFTAMPEMAVRRRLPNPPLGRLSAMVPSWLRMSPWVTHTDHFAAPAYDGIRRLALGQADAIRSAMIEGVGDIATTVLPVAAMSDLAMQYDHLEFMEIPTHAAQLVWVNNEKAPFDDLAFREALRMATHKQRVAIEAMQGFSNIADSGPVPNQLERWHNADLGSVPFDIDGARQILMDAGYGWDSSGHLHYPPVQ